MLNFNVDLAVQFLKTLIDNVQCVTCDKLIGPCVRFPCGHLVCEDCAEGAGECLYCATSPTGSYLLDKPQTARLNNASAVLTTFQDAFEIDVHKRQRISDQIKLEKQVFPQCIQAQYKYSNKRKSSSISINKENTNPQIFSGETITCSETEKMKKSHKYVQNWLNQLEDVPQNTPRKPFGDINVNTQVHKGKNNVRKLSKVKTQINLKQSTCLKRSHFKSINNSSSFLGNEVTTNLKNNDIFSAEKINKETDKHKDSNIINKCDRNESGIVIDDEPILVEDSDIKITDKDTLAWLAVLEEAERDRSKQNFSESGLHHSEVDHRNVDHSIVNNNVSGFEKLSTGNESDENLPAHGGDKLVSFYKKSSLFEVCNQCRQYINSNNSNSKLSKDNDVSIVINNSAFITTIKFSQSVQNNNQMFDKNSVAIQTDKSMVPPQHKIFEDGEKSNQKKRKILQNNEIILNKIVKPNVIGSLDVHSASKSNACTKLESNYCKDATKLNSGNGSLNRTKCLIIEDSDTDSNISHDNSFLREVVAVVHRTSAPDIEQRGILTLSKNNCGQRSKQPLRGHTPNSTDSSDKENLDPNRKKTAKFGKKHKSKK